MKNYIEIIESDLFLDMPLSSQALYFHLLMRVDDTTGFKIIKNIKKIVRMVNAQDDDLNCLIDKKFIYLANGENYHIREFLY
jgi:hypothetical protein